MSPSNDSESPPTSATATTSADGAALNPAIADAALKHHPTTESSGPEDKIESVGDAVATSISEKKDEGLNNSKPTAPDSTMNEPVSGNEKESSTLDDRPSTSSNAASVEPILQTSPPPPPPPPKDSKFLPEIDTQVAQPTSSQDPEKDALKQDDASLEKDAAIEKQRAAQDASDDTGSEIQSIMEQFGDGTTGPGAEEIMSPRLEIAGPMLNSPIVHPPRRSSLDPTRSGSQVSLPLEGGSQSEKNRAPSASGGPALGLGLTHTQSKESLASPTSQLSARQMAPLPPHPDPEPDLPFDFHRFLEQLRNRSADPVAKFLRSFLQEFGKKQWMVHEQVKIISDFLDFITKKMAQCDVWKTVSDAEFDNACEGMEKLVMNRLYSQTFSPSIPPPEPSAGRGRKRAGPAPGRRGQHQEDIERDDILAQKVRIYSWVREEHLDIPPLNEKGRKFLVLAQQELLKIGNYRAPRDKVICVLNCCKVIFGFLRNAQHDQSADSFIPLLIYIVLRANPPNLVSNVQYVLRFRNANKLTGEAGYYVSSLGGAIDFIERLDRTSLTISDEDFEKNVEAAVSAIAERHPPEEAAAAESSRAATGSTLKPEGATRASSSEAPPLPRRSTSLRNSNKSDSESDENAAVAGLLRTIQKPLSTIGRIFSDDTSPTTQSTSNQPPVTPQPPRVASRPRSQLIDVDAPSSEPPAQASATPARVAEDAAARQASKETEQARRLRVQEEGHVVETLCGMFPGLDREVVEDVVRANEGRIGSAVDACLALSG